MDGPGLGGLFVGEAPRSVSLGFSSWAPFPKEVSFSWEVKVWLPEFRGLSGRKGPRDGG